MLVVALLVISAVGVDCLVLALLILLLQTGDPVVVSLAPSFIANYKGIGIASMRRALMKLGFAGVEETALGATIVKNEYERMLREESRDIIISSCCHSINLLIQKYFPAELEYLADVMSPMQAHCADIKKRMPKESGQLPLPWRYIFFRTMPQSDWPRQTL